MTSRPTRPPGRTNRLVAALAAVTLAAAACSSDDGNDRADAAPEDIELIVSVASFDVAVGSGQRLMAGVLAQDRSLLAFGQVTFQLGYLGDQAMGQATLSQAANASFRGIPGMEPEGASSQPTLLSDTSGAGVYVAHVDLDEPGFWGLRVVAELADGRELEGQTTFAVLAEPQVVTVGEDAPRTENPTIDDVEAGTVEAVALDSRAQGDDATVEDRHLHVTVIAESIAEGRPLVVVVSTPVYCMSRFCGPLTETLANTAQQFSDRADFVHLEVWENFDEQRLNPAAAEWIQTEDGGNEPWVFLVDEDGRIAARWDNVLDLRALENELDAMPAIPRADAFEDAP